MRSLITAPVNPSELVTLKGNTHPLARPLYDRGGAPPDLAMDRMLLVLKRSPERQAALHNLINQLQDKHSPNYHQWLTPEEFGRQFGASDQDVQTVANWLQSSGFKVNRVTKGRSVIEFSGNAGQVQAAFHTAIHQYAVNGEEHWANNQDLQIPAALAPVVAGVSTLHTFFKKPQIHISDQHIPAKMADGRPQFTSITGLHALSPGDYAVIYNANPILGAPGPAAGFGSSIALVARSNVLIQDLIDFSNLFGVGTANVVLDGPDPGTLLGADEGEAVLDASWAGALAPGAGVSLVVSASTNTTDGVDLSELYIIDNNFADIMSESFGGCEAGATSAQAMFISQLAEQAAAQGITYIVSSGDSGAEGCDDPGTPLAAGPLSVNVLASSEFNVAVGGTMFNENGNDSRYWRSSNSPHLASALSYIPEDVWNESCTTAVCGDDANLFAGGGGASMYFSKPFWQAGVAGIPNDGARDVPDVSLTAAGHDPYLLCFEGSCTPDLSGKFFLVGAAGTSASAPSFAGIMALVKAALPPQGIPAHVPRIGQANWVLYQLAAKENLSNCNASSSTLPAGACIFNDVTIGNNAVPGETGFGTPTAPYQAGVGYDLATGLGSVNITNLVQQWNSVSLNSTATSLQLSPASIAHGSPANVNVSVSSGAGVPSGDVSLATGVFGTEIPGNLFPLSNGTASGSINTLPGGTYGVMAHYAGNGTFASSDSSPFVITVTPESSSTSLNVLTSDTNGNIIPFGSGPYGSFVYVRADVSGASGFGMPTGSVIFTDFTGSGFFPQNPYPLNSQGTAATPGGLFTFELGQHSVGGSYSGDSSFSASTSPLGNFSITQASSSMTIASQGAPQGALLIANVETTSGGAPPGGPVTLSIDGNSLGSQALFGLPALIDPVNGAVFRGARGIAFFADLTLSNGAHTVTASYGGDVHYAASSAQPTAINLQPDFSLLPPPLSQPLVLRAGQSGSVVLNIKSLDGFTGSISFSCSQLPLSANCQFNPTTVSGGGSTTMTLTTQAAVARQAALPGAKRAAPWAASGGMLFFGIILLGAASPRRFRGRIMWLTVFAVLLSLVACGGGGGSSAAPPPPPPPATPAGNYVITVTATSGSVSHIAPVFVTVTP